jgi:AraC family transcriptional regulator
MDGHPPGRPMPDPRERPIQSKSLYESPVVRVREYHCSICRGGPGPEEESDTTSLVLMRRGAFCRHFGQRKVTADVNQSAFFSAGSTYRVSHPQDDGDRGTVFVVPPRILNDFIREWDPAYEGGADAPFPFTDGPCSSDVFWRHRELIRILENDAEQAREPFWVDVAALQIVADSLDAGFARKGLPARNRKQDTAADHRELVEAGKLYFADHMGDRLTLDGVARELNTSPFHFARLFQHGTGVPIHRYLTLLRLRASLERLMDAREDLTTLALELGFSSHSHFSDLFRREFGVTPSEFRKRATFRAAAEMRKNLKA